MKIRTGFVSNSSSSSFIIALPAGMEPTAENFHRELFGTVEGINFGSFLYDEQRGINSWDLVKDIVEQITPGPTCSCDPDDCYCGQKYGKIPPEKLYEYVSLPWRGDDTPDFDDYKNEETGKYDWPAYEAARIEAEKRFAAKLAARFEGKDLYNVSYSDNDGSFNSEAEHGDALNGRPNVIRFSHH